MAQKLAALGQRVVTQTPPLVTRWSFKALGVAKKAQPHVERFWGNAKVEMAPPKPSDWPAIKKSFGNLQKSAMSGKFLDLTMKEVAANTLVVAEIAFWFYVGEVIGRRSLIGYNV